MLHFFGSTRGLGKKLFLIAVGFILSGCPGYIGIDQSNPKTPVAGAPSAGPGVALQIVGPSSAAVGTCQRYDVQIIDGNGLVAATYPSLLTFELALNIGASAQVFTDASCSIGGTSLPVLPGGTAPFYLKNAVREFVTVGASTLPVAFTGSRLIQFVAGAPASLDVVVNPANPVNACVQVAIRASDVSGNATPIHSGVNVNVSITGLTHAALFSDNQCLTAISATTIPAGSDTKIIYVQSNDIGNAQITASALPLTPDTENVAFLAGSSPRIVLVGPASNVVAGTCVLVRAESQRFDGTPLIAIGAALPVTLNMLVGVGAQFYADSQCLVTSTSVSIPASQYTANFYVKTVQAPQTVTVSGTSPGYTSNPANINYIPVAPTVVRVQGTPPTIPAGQCGLGQVALLDSFGQPAYVVANTAVSIAATSPNATQTDFYSSNDCSGPTVSSLTVPMCTGIGACTNTVGFSFRPKKVGSLVINPASAGMTAVSAGVQVITPTGLPFSLRLTRLTDPVTTDTCVLYQVDTIDAFGNFINMVNDFVLAASATSLSGLGTFYSDLSCGTVTNSITILQNTHSRQFTFRDVKVETVLLTLAGNPGPVVQDTLTILPGVAAKLVFNNVPGTVPATRCSTAISVSQMDMQNNLTTVAVSYNLSATGGVVFYSDANCSQSVSQMSIASGSSTSALFYFAGPTAGNVTLTATASSPASVTVPASAAVLLGAAPALHIGLSCDANNLLNNTCPAFTAGSCQAVYVTSLDNNNLKYIPIGSSVQVAMSSNSSNPALFYSNANCTTQVSSVNLTAAVNPGLVYVKNTIAQTFSVTGTPNIGSAGSLSLTTNPGAPFKLVIKSSGPNTIFTNQCAGPYEVESQDFWGNASPVSSQLAVQFLSSLFNNGGVPANLKFHDDSACTTQNVAIASGVAVEQFYVKSGTAGSLAAKAGATGLNTSDARNIAISQSANIVMIANNTQISAINFGQVVVSTSSLPITVTLKNASSAETANVAALNFSGAPFEIVSTGTTCATAAAFTLAANATCDVVLKFSPTAVQSYTGSLAAAATGATSGASQTTTISLTGSGIAAPFSPIYLGHSALNFGSVNVGSTTTLSTTLVNPNTAYAVVVNSLNVSGTGFSAVVNSPCGNTFPLTVAANTSCPITVSFAPASSGSKSGTMVANYVNPSTSAAAATAATTLSGTGVVSDTTLRINPSTYNFGTIQAGMVSSQVSFEIENIGPQAADSISLNNLGTAFQVSMGTCTGTLQPAAKCNVTVWFAPGVMGSYVAYVTLQFRNAVSGNQANIGSALTLTGAASQAASQTAANLTFDVSAINFGSVQRGQYLSRQTLVQNVGDATATNLLRWVSTSYEADGFYVSAGTCGTSLAPGAYCFLDIGFRPIYSGYKAGAVALKYRSNGVDKKTIDIQVNGWGY